MWLPKGKPEGPLGTELPRYMCCVLMVVTDAPPAGDNVLTATHILGQLE